MVTRHLLLVLKSARVLSKWTLFVPVFAGGSRRAVGVESPNDLNLGYNGSAFTRAWSRFDNLVAHKVFGVAVNEGEVAGVDMACSKPVGVTAGLADVCAFLQWIHLGFTGQKVLQEKHCLGWFSNGKCFDCQIASLNQL